MTQQSAANAPAKRAPKPRSKLNLNKSIPSTAAKTKRAVASRRRASQKSKATIEPSDTEMSEAEQPEHVDTAVDADVIDVDSYDESDEQELG
jgi:hypothetical protein